MLKYIPHTNLDVDCHNVSNITVMTDATEASNVTSISIEHDSNTFYTCQEHDNKVQRAIKLSFRY